MNKQHFEAFAEEIKNFLENKEWHENNKLSPEDVRFIAMEMCEMIRSVATQFNSRFDIFKFREACGL